MSIRFLTGIYSTQKRDFCMFIKHNLFVCKFETKTKLDKYYEDHLPSIVITVVRSIRCGHTSTNDAERSRRPNVVTTLKNPCVSRIFP